MAKVKLYVDRHFARGEISPLLYGSFVEHMGRVVYSGIYEPSHACADGDGFRRDVLDLVHDMGVTCVRYPGGNFVSGYDWRDGVGPKEARPRKREVAWRSIETNEFGTDEFMRWATVSGVTPILTVNLGTGGIEDALSLLEYCNLPIGTRYSDMRKANGHVSPYRVPIWCLGNEMDGGWQIGSKTPEEYAALAAQTAYAMKRLDPSIKTVVCGSSSAEMATYTDWERIVLERAWDDVDYLSLHHYYGGQEKGTLEFLAQSEELERYLKTIISVCDVVQAKKKSRKRVDICFDEWGVWEVSGEEVAEQANAQDWPIAPALSEHSYTMEDALLFSSMLMSLVRHCDRVKVACQSLLTNISAAIMTERGGEAWAQTIYYPFSYMSKYGRGTVLRSVSNGLSYRIERGDDIPTVDSLAIWNHERNELVFFLVNRLGERVETQLEIGGFSVTDVPQHTAMYHKDCKQTNQMDHNAVTPREMDHPVLRGDMVLMVLEPYSWNMVRVPIV